jgi:hypothetical protein
MRWQRARKLNGVKLKEEIEQEVKGGMGWAKAAGERTRSGMW